MSNQEYTQRPDRKLQQMRTSTTKQEIQSILYLIHQMDELDLHCQTLLQVEHTKTQQLKRDKLQPSIGEDSCE